MEIKAPQISTDKTDPIKIIKIWRTLIAAQSLLSILWLLLIPKEPGNAVLFGFSLRRLILLIPLAFPLLLIPILKKSMAKKDGWPAWLAKADNKAKLAVFLVIGGFLFAIAVWSFVFLFHFMRFFPDLGAYIRLLPIAACYFLLGIEAVLAVPILLYPPNQPAKAAGANFPFKPFLALLLVFIFGLIAIAVTGWGIDPERVSIISLGAPILEGQIWYIIGILMLVMAAAFAWGSIPSQARPKLAGRIDLLAALSLWLIAVVLWMSLPLPGNNYFAPQVQAPNFEKYPFSDAAQYDINGLFVYFGSLKNVIISKPLYVTFLALIHAIVGLSYERTIFVQTLIVAFFPVVLYFIGKELHSRLGGIAIALFAIMREVTGIQATSIANVSSTKLLLSDMPAALLASLLALVLIRWFKVSGKKISGHEFIVGGIIGAFILTRIQTMALVPFAMVLIVIRYFRSLKSILISSLIFLIGVGLVITPVLIRNHSITGVYWVDNPSSSQRLYTKFVDIADENIEIGEATTREEIVNRNLTVISSAIMNGMGEIFDFTMDSFMRNEISSFLTLPIRLGNKIPFLDFLTINTPFWTEVYSKPNIINILVIFFNFGLMALGFSVVFRNNPLASLVLLGFHAFYSLSSAVVRLSGWRFILPVDWILYTFYVIGLIEIMEWIFRKIIGWDLKSKAAFLAEHPTMPAPNKRKKASILLYGVLFVLIGAAIPIRETLLPPLYPELTNPSICGEIQNKIDQSEFKGLAENFYDFCLSQKTRVYYGLGIYPRFFQSEEGFYNRSYDPWFGQQPYARLVFNVIGKQSGKVYIRSENAAIDFPNGARVFAVGVDKTKFEAQIVLIEGKERSELIMSPEIISGSILFTDLLK